MVLYKFLGQLWRKLCNVQLWGRTMASYVMPYSLLHKKVVCTYVDLCA